MNSSFQTRKHICALQAVFKTLMGRCTKMDQSQRRHTTICIFVVTFCHMHEEKIC